jgi:TRAP-type mannitol/chloroaromatic compound transport system substrate-binding protein
MLADFTARNNQALKTLVEEHGVELRKFPDEVIRKLRELSAEVVAEEAANDPMSAKVYKSFKAFNEQVLEWSRVSEQAFLEARTME